MSSSEDESSSEDFREKHECTDVCCSLLFVASGLALLVVMGYALAAGDTRRLSRGMDVNGQLCGLDAAVADKPLLYFCPKDMTSVLRILHINKSHPVCVSACPTGTFDFATNATTVSPGQVPGCPPTVSDAYVSETIANLYCLPSRYYSASALKEVHESASDLVDSVSAGGRHALRAWPVLLLVGLAATILGYIYLWLLRVTAKCLIWLCVGVSMVALIALGAYLWMCNEELVPEPTVTSAVVTPEDADAARLRQAGRAGLKAAAALLWALAALVLCLACCCGQSVELSTACVQTACVVIWRMPLMLLSPFVKAVTKAFLALLFFYGFMHLWVLGEAEGIGLHKRFRHSPEQWAMIIFYIFVAYWVLAFVTALYQFSIAYAVAKYYEAGEDEDGDRDVDSCAVVEGTLVGATKHMGSLAYGSAVIAALELIQRALEYTERKNEELGEGGNKCVKCILNSCLCCCRCLEGIIQFINKNAYIDIAVTGDVGFCQAVRNVAKVVIDFGAAMAILNGATFVFQVVGTVAITALCGLLASAALTNEAFTNTESSWYIGNPTVPILLACALAFMIAWAFMAIFDVTTDTLLYCYAEDKREHHGQAVHVPSDMRRLYEEAEQQVRDKRGPDAAEEQQPKGFRQVRR